jgi:hypothetical protein
LMQIAPAKVSWLPLLHRAGASVRRSVLSQQSQRFGKLRIILAFRLQGR